MLARLGHFLRLIRGAAWLLTVAMLAGAVITIGPSFTSKITAPESGSSAGLEILTSEFPSAGGDSGTIVYKADRGVTCFATANHRTRRGSESHSPWLY